MGALLVFHIVLAVGDHQQGHGHGHDVAVPVEDGRVAEVADAERHHDAHPIAEGIRLVAVREDKARVPRPLRGLPDAAEDGLALVELAVRRHRGHVVGKVGHLPGPHGQGEHEQLLLGQIALQRRIGHVERVEQILLPLLDDRDRGVDLLDLVLVDRAVVASGRANPHQGLGGAEQVVARLLHERHEAVVVPFEILRQHATLDYIQYVLDVQGATVEDLEQPPPPPRGAHVESLPPRPGDMLLRDGVRGRQRVDLRHDLEPLRRPGGARQVQHGVPPDVADVERDRVEVIGQLAHVRRADPGHDRG
mmetsp:Transcript_82295/g.251499  ORF Transcript_82295/g.251499 Transcript_82295/m.251499 type:complete len:306 (+) Transcript_82295:538-1455(+)